MSLIERIKKLERIYDGWKNFVFLSPTIEALAKGRAEHCAACEFAVESTWTSALGDKLEEVQGIACGKCNCPLSAKLRSVGEWCPLPTPKW